MSKDSTISQKINSIAIGGFDGMHIGHQRLFERLGNSGAIVVIETGYANLTPKKEREKFTHYPIFYYELDNIRVLNGEEFIALLKSNFPKLKKIVVGYDFHFGKDRKYSISQLRELFDGEVVVVDEVSLHGDSIHSHKIRAKIQLGDVEGANAFLAHNYTIYGDVVKGQGIGAKELVATINLHVKNFLLPREGVYATLSRVDGVEHLYPSVSFVGHRVTTDGTYAVESHILGTKLPQVKFASISFIGFIRDNKKFDNLELLKEAIEKDIKEAKKIHKLLIL